MNLNELTISINSALLVTMEAADPVLVIEFVVLPKIIPGLPVAIITASDKCFQSQQLSYFVQRYLFTIIITFNYAREFPSLHTS